MKWRTNMGSVVFTMFTNYLINNTYYGILVGTMPFEPWGLISSVSHRGLEGEDLNQYNLLFFLVLSNAAFRGYISKALGYDPPRMPIEH